MVFVSLGDIYSDVRNTTNNNVSCYSQSLRFTIDLPYLELLAIWIFSIPCIIGIDKIFHQMLYIFVKEEVKKGDHDERIIKIISHLIKVEIENHPANLFWLDSRYNKNLSSLLENFSYAIKQTVEGIDKYEKFTEIRSRIESFFKIA
ncbi:hypothetical protein FHEFKHOI_01436 [Candidatus Methanoperedenaceae archaeon GB50]|nr:MAG: hypothetical protein KBONHNOK_00285 [Candidatus Methanoperedenaceae archaeon GB50]CAD7773554.1 hypothetical protein AIOGIFDO_01432 [Candidatus Methanoperedenaceae archaeon GB37]CAD7773668.1 hypothetical protein FHEFKHOI_01436 [Candidatus Methanoperedenaceae archaeon GB50]